jgi:hypothetical protein
MTATACGGDNQHSLKSNSEQQKLSRIVNRSNLDRIYWRHCPTPLETAMPKPNHDLEAIYSSIDHALGDGRQASIRQLGARLRLSNRVLLQALRALAQRGVVRRDPTPPLSPDTLWRRGDGIPLPPRRNALLADGAAQQRLVAAVNTGRARRDPLVAALFGPAPGVPC